MPKSTAAFVINLDRSPDRLRSAADQLDQVGLAWQRVRAIDTQAMADMPAAHFDKDRFERNVGRSLHLSEIAMSFSHHKALRAFLDSQASVGLILEDDFKILDRPGFPGLLDALESSPGWDFVRASCSGRYPLPVPVTRLTADFVLAAPLLKFCCAAAYFVNRRAAETLLTAWLPFDLPFDHLMDQPWKHDLRYRVVWPAPVTQVRGFGHTIEYKYRLNKPPSWKRHSALFYRLGSGLRRFAHNSRQGFFVFEWMKNAARLKQPPARHPVSGTLPTP